MNPKGDDARRRSLLAQQYFHEIYINYWSSEGSYEENLDCVMDSGIVNGRGTATAGLGEIYFAGAGATGAEADATGSETGRAGAIGASGAGAIGTAGATNLTSVSEAPFLGIWIPVKILETSFCNPSLPLCIVQILRGHNAICLVRKNSQLVNRGGLLFTICRLLNLLRQVRRLLNGCNVGCLTCCVRL